MLDQVFKTTAIDHSALSKAGFTVLRASSGVEALRLITSRPCDLLVTDLSMPDGEGIETIRLVRKRDPIVKILAISGAFNDDMLRTAELLGADASLAKPFTPDDLIAAVRTLLPADAS
jgi:two-component system cell cycle sensor histidine kinase/response regulator CckA